MSIRSFRALGIDVHVDVDDPEIDTTLAALTGTYEPSHGEPTLTYRFEAGAQSRLLRNGDVIYTGADTIDLPPVFELDLYRQVVARCTGGWTLHAAVLASDGGAIVLSGRSGAGKSTLATELVARGLGYCSDEMAHIGADGKITGLCRPISFQSDQDVPPSPRDFVRARCPIRAHDGRRIDSILLHPPSAQLRHAPMPVRTIVIVDHAPGAVARLQEVSTGAALTALWDNSYSSGEAAFRIAVDTVKRVPVLSLISGAVTAAVGEIENLVGGVPT